jgi:hypothetical protein
MKEVPNFFYSSTFYWVVQNSVVDFACLEALQPKSETRQTSWDLSKKKKKKKKKKKPTPPAPSPRGTLMGISMPRTMNLTRLLPIVVTGCPTAGQGAHGQWQPPSLRRRSTWSEYPPDPLTGTTTDLKKTPQIPRLRILRILGPVLPHRVYGNVKM